MLLIYIILQQIPFLHTAKWKGALLFSINKTAKSKHLCLEHILTQSCIIWQCFWLQIDTANAAPYVVWLSTVSRLLDGFTCDWFEINRYSSEINFNNYRNLCSMWKVTLKTFTFLIISLQCAILLDISVRNPAVSNHFAVNYHFIHNCFTYQNYSMTQKLCADEEKLNNQIWACSRFTVPRTPFSQTTVTD